MRKNCRISWDGGKLITVKSQVNEVNWEIELSYLEAK